VTVWLAFGIATTIGLLVTEDWARNGLRFVIRWSWRASECFLLSLGLVVAISMWLGYDDIKPISVVPHDLWRMLLSIGINLTVILFVIFFTFAGQFRICFSGNKSR
jgi:hypothetical protein